MKDLEKVINSAVADFENVEEKEWTFKKNPGKMVKEGDSRSPGGFCYQ